MTNAHYYLTRGSHDKLKRKIQLNEPLGGGVPLGNLISPGDPQIVRLGKLYTPVIAAEFDVNKTLTKSQPCEVLLHRIRADGSTMEAFEDIPEPGYWIFDQPGELGNEVVCLRDRSINDPANPNVAQPGWTVFPLQGGGGEDRSYTLAMGSAAIAENVFPGNTLATYIIKWNWENPAPVIVGSGAFSTYDPDGDICLGITVTQSGYYRVFCEVRFEAETTNLTSEIQRGTLDIIKVASGGVQSIIEGTTDKVESLHINGADYPSTLGALNGRASCDSKVYLQANEAIAVQFAFNSGVRGLTAVGESFGAELLRAGPA